MIKRIVIIGYGNIAKKHIEVLRALGCQITASCNRSEEKNTLSKTESNIPRTYSDLHEMIREENPDGIVVCVSFWNMYRILTEVIPYGIPILTEKPTGTSHTEHTELTALATKHNTSVMVGLNRRHYSVLNKAISDAGGKKNITNVMIEWSEDPFHLETKKKLNREQIHRIIFENTIHGIDILTYLTGEIEKPVFNAVNLGEPFRWLMSFGGKTVNNTLYQFNSSWDNFVPWRVVFYAKNKRYVFAPLETCEVMEGKQKYMIEPDDIDKQYKAGFYRQASIFIKQNEEIKNNDLGSVNNSMCIAQNLFDLF